MVGPPLGTSVSVSFPCVLSLISAWLIVFCASASGETHKLYRPLSVSSSIRTYRDAQVVGVLFPRAHPAGRGGSEGLITKVKFQAARHQSSMVASAGIGRGIVGVGRPKTQRSSVRRT
jgi:hypothetical protein